MRFDVVSGVQALDDREAAWRFIRDFAAGWLRPLGDGDGAADTELDAAEARLGVRLPPAVREAYRLLGMRDDLTSANGTLLRPDQLDYDEKRSMLVFRAAHQGVTYFAASLADPAAEDPPVFLSQTIEDIMENSGALMLSDLSAADDPGEKWVPFLDRFSLACVDMVLWEAVEAGPHADGRDLEDGEPESLVAGLTELRFPRYEASRWYADSEILLRVEEVWIGVLGRTREALDRFREEHPGFWVEGEI
jgi:hypothetical protein